MNAVGSAAAVIFGIIWTALTFSMNAPVLFSMFGLVFVAIGVIQMVYHFKNATGKDRFSSFDITDEYDESDPLNEKFGRQSSAPPPEQQDCEEENGNFCPYCGARVKPDYEFCKQCGKKI